MSFPLSLPPIKAFEGRLLGSDENPNNQNFPNGLVLSTGSIEYLSKKCLGHYQWQIA